MIFNLSLPYRTVKPFASPEDGFYVDDSGEDVLDCSNRPRGLFIRLRVVGPFGVLSLTRKPDNNFTNNVRRFL